MDIITLDLPDNISFEEIALKWCQEKEDQSSRFITFDQYEDGINVTFVENQNDEGEDLFDGNEDFYCLSGNVIEVAWFVINEKKFKIDDQYEDNFDFILDYIKERSNV